MSDVFYLILRRMRYPLILIVTVYTVCTIGLALMPGVDADGNPEPGMGIFHAFYVISYTGSTIGFGEIPQAFSPQQRLWMIISIYATVVGWSYAIVAVLALLQQPAFTQALQTGRFTRAVSRLRSPFYIVCGYGESGRLVCEGLDRLNLKFVVIEANELRLEDLKLDEYHYDPPATSGDAAQPDVLTRAGLMSEHCRGVVALANDDNVNQAIATTCRLLRPGLPILARIRDPEIDTHLGVFGSDIVLNPFARFADHLARALLAPEHYRLREILTGLPGRRLPEPHHPPRGHWIVCSYGRFGHAIVRRLRNAGQVVTVVDMIDDEDGVDVKGYGTEEGTLQAAGLDDAAGIVVGHQDDLRNLAIAVNARDIKPEIFVVTRMNQSSNHPLFDAFEGDLAMEPSRLVAQEFLSLITTPLLGSFLEILKRYSEQECAELSDRLGQCQPGQVPYLWSVDVGADDTAAARAFADDVTITVKDLLTNPLDRQKRTTAVALLLAREDRLIDLPHDQVELKPGDQVLMAGTMQAQRQQDLILNNDNVLDYVCTGEGHGTSWVWRKLFPARH